MHQAERQRLEEEAARLAAATAMPPRPGKAGSGVNDEGHRLRPGKLGGVSRAQAFAIGPPSRLAIQGWMTYLTGVPTGNACGRRGSGTAVGRCRAAHRRRQCSFT